MLEILTGDRPFRELPSGPSVIRAVMQGRTPSVQDLQTEPVLPWSTIMVGIMQWCWKYEPSERATARRIVLLVGQISSPLNITRFLIYFADEGSYGG
ncbi:hypothetical protein FRC08_007303 [Ceratobasidium sp. 394]|nr:hypothetical protein FRC08_007303 [Ceratobasidium sp. 394]